MTEGAPQENITTVQSALLLRAAFRQQLAVLLERVGASKAVDDEELTLISRSLLGALRDLDRILETSAPPGRASEPSAEHAYGRPLHNAAPHARAMILSLPQKHSLPVTREMYSRSANGSPTRRPDQGTGIAPNAQSCRAKLASRLQGQTKQLKNVSQTARDARTATLQRFGRAGSRLRRTRLSRFL